MSRPLDRLSDDERARLKTVAQPRWVDPMLATLTDERFSDPDWIYERKLDGVRLVVFRKGGEVRITTRNRKERNATWPELVDALQGDGPDWVVDGEVVTFEGRVTSFSRLQERIQVDDPDEARRLARTVPATLYLFDLVHFDGHALDDVPLRARKKVLRAAFDFTDPLRFTPHRNESGEAYWKEACRKGWEGIIAKDARSPYVHSRSKSWLKFKCVHRQELVVGGFTDPHGERVGFGALLLGYWRGDDFVYAGKVGTGWDDETLERLRSRLDGLERETPPFDDAPGGALPDDEVHWVTPKLVAEIGFTEWTDAGFLRHPRFLGLRRDKDPREVVRERPD